METENESGKGEVVASHFELFAAFEKKKKKEKGWLQVEKGI